MAKTPWITFATALMVMLSLTACDGGGDAPEQSASESDTQPVQKPAEDGMGDVDEADDGAIERTGREEAGAPAEDTLTDDATADDTLTGDTVNDGSLTDDAASDGPLAEEEGGEIGGDADFDDSWESTEEEVNRALEEIERLFEEAEKELNEQFEAAEEQDVTEELDIDEPGEPVQP